MQRHVAYWQDLLNRDVGLPSARCFIPKTLGASACSTSMMSRARERSGRATPAVQTGTCTFELVPMELLRPC